MISAFQLKLFVSCCSELNLEILQIYKITFAVWNLGKKMRVTRSTTLLSRQKERQEIVLIPEEILIRIWSFLDFDTIQKICVLVSKSWFDKIQFSMKLSGQLKIQCIDQW